MVGRSNRGPCLYSEAWKCGAQMSAGTNLQVVSSDSTSQILRTIAFAKKDSCCFVASLPPTLPYKDVLTPRAKSCLHEQASSITPTNQLQVP